MKINYKNAKKHKSRVSQLEFAVFGVWAITLEENSLLEAWEEYPNLTLTRINKMSDKEFDKLLKFALKEENELCF